MTLPEEIQQGATALRVRYDQVGPTPAILQDFRGIICRYYRLEGRDLPWRRTADPYCILVSECMLQQTRVETVLRYYPLFLRQFPDMASLSRAPFPEVLRSWKGLGYNRRARALHDTARRVMQEYGGVLPSDDAVLRSFPGIGATTAAALRAFAFQQRAILLETNVRTVYLYFFFHGKEAVTDREILPLVELTLPPTGFRDWYYALMDVGVLLKREVGNLNRRMRSYRPQPPFEGSDRQWRGRILARLMEQEEETERAIQEYLGISPLHLEALLSSLEKEGFLLRYSGRCSLRR